MKLKHIAMIAFALALPAAALIGQEEAGGAKDPTKENNSKMMEMRQKMGADAKAQDAELEQLVTAMNSATGDKKTEAVAAVVAKLVEQRKEMRAKMSGMDGDRMAAMECCKAGMGTMNATECCKAGMGTDATGKPASSPMPMEH